MSAEAISGIRRTIRERVDGSLIVQVEIDPRFKADFLRLFPSIDAPIALAPLAADFEKREAEKPKGGMLARLAAQLGNDPEFQRFIEASDADDAANKIRKLCRIQSRADLDNDPDAAAEFHRVIRGPWIKYRISRGLS